MHAFARCGAHTGAGLGAGVVWVAADAWALHGAVRVMQVGGPAGAALAPLPQHRVALAVATQAF